MRGISKLALLLTAALAMPSLAVAAPESFYGGRSIVIASSTAKNMYGVGASVIATAPVGDDLVLVGGSIVDDAPVKGDALLLGGSIVVHAPITGDLRAIGGKVVMEAPVGGDLVALSASLEDRGGGAKTVFVLGATVKLLAGAKGEVTVYGNNVTLGGAYEADVTVVATGRVTLLPETTIRGQLRYQAPEEAQVPDSARITGGVHYTGASYLPTEKEARAIALAGFGVFLFVKIIGVLILAGLIAGLFPRFAEKLGTSARRASFRQVLLMVLLGFGILIAAPVLILLLSLTFVGLGLGLMLATVYAFSLMLSFTGAGIIVGALISQTLFKRSQLRVSDAVFGMLILFLIWIVPIVGWAFVLLLTTYALGEISLIFYQFAFSRESEVDNQLQESNK